MDLILKLGGLQAVLLAFILFFRSDTKQRGRRLLALLLLSLGIASCFHSFNDLSFYLDFPHLIRLNWGLPLIFGPLLYLYVRQLTVPEARVSKSDIQFFTPYILNILLLLPFFLQDGESKIQILDYFTAIITRGTDIYQIYYYLLQVAIAYWGWHYTIKCFPLLTEYQNRLLATFSEIEKRQLSWLKTIIYGFLGLFALFVLVLWLTIKNSYPDFDYEQYFYVGSFGLVYWMTFKAVNLQTTTPSATPKPAAPKVPEKETPPQDKALEKQLLQYMESEKPYLDSELTAVQLAHSLQITRHQLSQVLNEQLGKNFYDFINSYRVAAFKAHLIDPDFQSFSLLGIALEAGFKSKSSFNAVFKKLTGMTPSQYKKTLNQ